LSDKPASRRPRHAARAPDQDLVHDLGAEAPPRPSVRAPRSGGADGQPAIAVAIKHEPGDLPTVIASGRGSLAERILEIAFAAGIKVREDADLAQMLAAVETDCPIPIACFEAVAEILTYLYRANASAAGAAAPVGAAGGTRRP
jgi:flagellar biosynthesis protein